MESTESEHLANLSLPLRAAVIEACAAVTHNLNGQKLGRKGRVTRERILAAALCLIETSDEPPTLSSVARLASLGMTAIYNYFNDMTELLLAVLDPVMATAKDEFLFELDDFWSQETLFERSYQFITRYHGFWQRYARLLHLRNALADTHDLRLMTQRIESSRPVIEALVNQMGTEKVGLGPCTSMATVVMIGVERTLTLVTDRELRQLIQMGAGVNIDRYLIPCARLMAYAIQDLRKTPPQTPSLQAKPNL